MDYLLKIIIPLIILTIVIYGVLNNVQVYECFVEGAKEGLLISYKIFPYILAMLMAVAVFRESGVMDFLFLLFAPVAKLMGMPPEVLPLILIKPLSGSGALGVYADLIKNYGADSFIGRVASVIMGSTETIFYTLTVYFGAVGIKKIRHTLWAALLAELVAVIAAVTVVGIFF